MNLTQQNNSSPPQPLAPETQNWSFNGWNEDKWFRSFTLNQTKPSTTTSNWNGHLLTTYDLTIMPFSKLRFWEGKKFKLKKTVSTNKDYPIRTVRTISKYGVADFSPDKPNKFPERPKKTKTICNGHNLNSNCAPMKYYTKSDNICSFVLFNTF